MKIKETQNILNYNRIAKAIEFIKANFKQQPSLEDIASHINLSPFHFQRLFKEWAGTSPKKFLQYINIQYAKQLLGGQKNISLFDTAFETGLSGTGRLHDLFVNIEGMTPAEYKNGGENLNINYSFEESPFGNLIIASTLKGVCYMAFYTDEEEAFTALKNKFPAAGYQKKTDQFQENALAIFKNDWTDLQEIKLHLKGTDFQLKVWETLLQVPNGSLTTYNQIAKKIGNANASRAVGTAIGSNPIAFVIPCHRVIQTSGIIGGYMWGNTRKTAIIGWEASKKYGDHEFI
ncbi:DNA-O6-methylguanine--protein-cysteine S-methyltransferase; Transcriptional regulator Ada [Pseudopedobacter saltans DSM 12145]|uniref:methylated-DNA--[protein]-cysteine S-methyltransferase n=1 Tax=Pseudopedobacter saltans (strain ATCC 51119 / DSM 12145 / JCM 21818 / CCUG 39354 / LMG 10337 / NBRC 100064 / NCIMB 13643) TaxID=762903 RepID=F0S546_PSESL|nr:methylated-DNA--[protein]-cysteine S-methyltransferase [Pseudopedobacter saltans]ADY50963.1 DNA-O6-methylguanine--protein-cysteine S-methyltransferase; Transcriptional regulator Ada [Pseudopedobacter saltans DSM 12145]